ncbi:Transcriptional repressor CcpN, MarR family [Candidatus Syntrophocurvum alkaliphilum]|uniref:Transcriptional repressor CcpN, MarR family n=1 Tax=Candidatus Syntrophocurvum alkaliphilum TaxID=2293317 RepID=A0A6I6DBE5_9FIRM|nr:helix-turn-helix transcriptional regulator [Candidatus Syntrophocurvum alkaliphilum]QGT99975.1 Transcriptional repressor CcpN, MarR family [Candidatus Syntrophocurvum alkaliphilum]
MIDLNDRQEKILGIVKENGPITGEKLAELLDVTRAALRPDLAVLTMSGFLEAKPRVGYTYKSEGVESEIRRVLNLYRVKDIQSRPVVVKESCSIYDAIVTLFIEDTGSIFVVNDDNFLTGIVSRKDFLKTTLGQADIHMVPVSVIMTRMPNIITTSGDETVVEAIKKIVEHEVDSLPVVKCYIDFDDEEKLEVVGRITKTNIARLFLDLANKKDEGG